MKDDEEEAQEEPKDAPKKRTWDKKTALGLLICLLGVVCLILWGLISVLSPAVSDTIGASSAITIDGNGIFLIVAVAAVAVGAVILLKNKT